MSDKFNYFDEEQNNASGNSPDDEKRSELSAESERNDSINAENESTEKNPVEESAEYRYTWDNDALKDAEQKKKRKQERRIKVFAAVMTILTVLSVSALVVTLAMNNAPYVTGSLSDTNNSLTSESETVSDTSYPQFNAQLASSSDSLSLQEIAEKMDQSTVTVYCEGMDSIWGNTISFGSGFVISEDGYIVTNHHVIDEAKDITVIFYDDTEYEATLVGSDSLYDIAVLKIEGDDFIPAELGDSDELVVGDMVIAIGTPYSLDLAGTHTFGFISATDRKIKVTDGSNVVKTMTMLQTDATLNSGNSGGPLVNMSGQVIGINTMKLISDYEGIGFAIPMSSAIDIINQLIDNGAVTDPNGSVTASAYLGITVVTVDTEFYDLPQGVIVGSIETSGSAYKAGLREKDIITEFDGKTVESSEELIEALSEKSAGDEVTIKVYRKGETIELTFILDARPS